MFVDIEASGLLDGLEGRARAERVELIAWLLEKDFDVDQIRGSFAPILLPADRALGDDGSHVSAQEICEATRVDLEQLERLQRAVGLPRIDDPHAVVLTRADGEAVAGAKIFVDRGFDPDDVVSIVRVLGEGLGHAAVVMRQAALKSVLRPGATELRLAQAFETLAHQIQPQLGPFIEDLLRLQLRHSFETEAINAAERAAGTLPGAREVTVAFADLVGFTELGEAVPPEELEHVASRLAELARDVAVAPVRFVKTIGDEVMFVGPDPAALLNVVLDLVAAAAADDLPRLRAGVASGWAVSRAGDWYGSPVNVASRVTGAARPGTVLAAESARDMIGGAEGFTWTAAGARHLKGVSDEVKLFRARRATESIPVRRKP
jgi:adenylate cyclase